MLPSSPVNGPRMLKTGSSPCSGGAPSPLGGSASPGGSSPGAAPSEPLYSGPAPPLLPSLEGGAAPLAFPSAAGQRGTIRHSPTARSRQAAHRAAHFVHWRWGRGRRRGQAASSMKASSTWPMMEKRCSARRLISKDPPVPDVLSARPEPETGRTSPPPVPCPWPWRCRPRCPRTSSGAKR